MKKFSNITNQKVGQEPEKKEIKMNEEESFRFALMGLMDKYLHIQTYGPIDRYLRAGTIKITGKEALAEALADLMSDKSTLEKTILLESLKSKVGDWEAIDEKIEEVGVKWGAEKIERELAPHRNKVAELLEKYGQDEELLIEMVNKSAEKMKSHKTAKIRAIVAAEMKLDKISAIYENKANQLFSEK
jgi:uncharacterized membrane-anchored protein YhcB (DUF1043 family)